MYIKKIKNYRCIKFNFNIKQLEKNYEWCITDFNTNF